STHHMPLSMFISYVKDFCGEVVLIGVQPEQTEMGKHISQAVRNSMRKLAEAILEGRAVEIVRLE
ncbi:hydrogenase 3 maturation endopeptidase HyCI, partial [Candidatus Bathyarchaeota archaeon]|nr:hydrogenase 3 maturation endopeptidase HyCI [Candidatus Bathyarchaeota archaeon]